MHNYGQYYRNIIESLSVLKLDGRPVQRESPVQIIIEGTYYNICWRLKEFSETPWHMDMC